MPKSRVYFYSLVLESMGVTRRLGLPEGQHARCYTWSLKKRESGLPSPFSDGHGQNAHVMNKQLLGWAVPIRYLIL